MKELIGVTLAGVPIFSGTSTFGADAFIPPKSVNAPSLDQCMGSSSTFYHYHSFSPCILNTTLKTGQYSSLILEKQVDKFIEYIEQSMTPNLRRLIPIGIARDGHLIYGPYNNEGDLWRPCDVDVCNGRIING